MPPELASFFIRFLTTPGDCVLDPFAGSNTTGRVAEGLGRRWVSTEIDLGFAKSSLSRFVDEGTTGNLKYIRDDFAREWIESANNG
jgi:site-specific DNA-methyltransferase (cytosine-N4-specific)